MLNDKTSKFGSLVRVGIAALTIVASTQAFARGEGGGGGGGGGGEGGAGEVAISTQPQPRPDLPRVDAPPPLTIRARALPVVVEKPNCKLEMRQMRYC